MAWLADDSDEKAQARAFLERRIGNVMQFEKLKGQSLGVISAMPKPQEILSLVQNGPLSSGVGVRKGRRRRRRF